MKIRVMSDLHIEFFNTGTFDLPVLSDEKEMVLVLAGDIGLAKRPTTFKYFIEDMAERHRHIIFIAGNHEFYKGNFTTALGKIKEELKDFTNVSVLEKDSVLIDDVAFVCATLWTDMNNHDQLLIEKSRGMMNDYKLTRTGPKSEPWLKKLHPHDTIADHVNARHYIFEEIKKRKADGKKVVVVTHHLPSFQSVPEQYKGDPLNGAYATELFEDIMDNPYELHVHGHTHASVDYMIGNTRVVCNPFGYLEQEENPDFDPNMVIDI